MKICIYTNILYKKYNFYSKIDFHHLRYQRRKNTIKKNKRLAKKRYPQKSMLSIFSNEASDKSVAICPTALMKYISILSVHGARYHFLNVGRKAMKSMMRVSTTVLRIFFDKNQYITRNIQRPKQNQSNQFILIFFKWKHPSKVAHVSDSHISPAGIRA